jgi:hypothetical protein
MTGWFQRLPDAESSVRGGPRTLHAVRGEAPEKCAHEAVYGRVCWLLEKEMAVGALLEPALMGEDSGEGLQLVVYRSRGSRC